ncbi:Acyl-CoA desaturase BmorQPVE1, partial [Operophtera brumata]
MGDGWHNYHHAIPWDYKAAEEGMPFNVTARLIRLLETVGLAYDLKSASPEIKIIGRTGDGTHYFYGNEEDKSAITAFGPVHPLNPTYTSTE